MSCSHGSTEDNGGSQARVHNQTEDWTISAPRPSLMGECSETDLIASSSHSYFYMAWWARHEHAREFCWKILKKSQQVMWKSRYFLKTFSSVKISWKHVSLFPSLWKILTAPCCFPRLIFRFYVQVWCFTKWPHLIGPLLPICSQESAGDHITPLPSLLGMGIPESFHDFRGFEDHCGQWVEITGSLIFLENNCR